MERSKEQIAQGIRNLQKVKDMRAFVKDKFYPVLINTDATIDETKFFVGSFANMIMEQFLTLMKETKFEDLHLVDKLDRSSPEYEKFKTIVELFNGKNVYESRELVEGMTKEIQMMIDSELKSRKLSTLTPNFLE